MVKSGHPVTEAFWLKSSLVHLTYGHKRGGQFGNVIGAAGFHSDVDRGVAEIHAVINAIVRGFDDIGAVFGEDSGEPVQCAGIVGQMNAQTDQASVFDQAAFDDAREQGHVDVAAADQDGDFLAVQSPKRP